MVKCNFQPRESFFTVSLHLGINLFVMVVKRHGVTLSSAFESSEETVDSGTCLGLLKSGRIPPSSL